MSSQTTKRTRSPAKGTSVGAAAGCCLPTAPGNPSTPRRPAWIGLVPRATIATYWRPVEARRAGTAADTVGGSGTSGRAGLVLLSVFPRYITPDDAHSGQGQGAVPDGVTE